MYISVDPYSDAFKALNPIVQDCVEQGKGFSEKEHFVVIGNTRFAFLEPDNKGFALTLGFDKKQREEVGELLDSVNIEYSFRSQYP